jgi:spermidine synthase
MKTTRRDFLKPVAAPAEPHAAAIRWIMIIYICSGVCSLIDEVVWVRLLKLTLGNTVYASSIVVSIFMAGLALGALIMSRYADTVTRRLRLYALLEVGATLSALSLPWALRLLDTAYGWFFIKYHPSPAELMLVQVILSALLLLVPTMFMGSTLPLLARYVTALQQRIGRRVGRLYTLNMLGAALGCYLAGFVLIRIIGVMGTLYIAAAINLLVAFAGWMLSRFHDTPTEPPPQTTKAQLEIPGIEQPTLTKRCVLMAAFFSSGLISIGYELVWMRSIVLLLGGFTYVFSAVLTIYLLGNVIGAWIGSGLSKRLKNPALAFGTSLTCLGISGMFYVPWLCMWALKATSGPAGFLKMYADNKGTLCPLIYSAFLFLIPSVMMGIGFPLALQAWGRYHQKVGRTTGAIYAVNTIGAVIGGLVTGFLLIPFLGAQLSITVLGLLGLCLGATMVHINLPPAKILRRILCPAAAVVLAIVALIIPADLYKQKIVSLVGQPGSKTLAVREGLTTTVSVKRNTDGTLVLMSDRVSIAGDDIHRSAQKTLGHLSALLHSDATDVLSIGFGAGETTLCLAQHDLDRIDCVEIAPEVVQVAIQYFTHINLGNQLDQKVNLTYMDAKSFLYLTEKHYDIIINDADIPSYSGSAPLFAKEHFQNAMDHLNPKGLFITKLHLSGISIDSFDSILGTFLRVCPYVTIWFPTTKPYSFFYLIGSKQPQVFSPKNIDDELENQNVRNSVAYLNFNNSLDVLSCYIGDKKDIDKYLSKGFRLNSDYSPFVEFNRGEFSHDERLLKMDLFLRFIQTVRHDSLVKHIDFTGISDTDRDKWIKDHQLVYKASTHLLNSHGQKNPVEMWQSVFDGLSLIPDHPALLKKQNQCLDSAYNAIGQGQADDVLMNINLILKTQPKFGAAWLAKSWAQQQKKQLSPALTAAQNAVKYAPQIPRTHNNLGSLLLKLGQTDKAVTHLDRAVRLDPNDVQLRLNLGLALNQNGKFDQAHQQFREMAQLRPDNAQVHFVLALFLTQRGQIDQAIAEYRRVLQIEPDHKEASENLNKLLPK